jgi:mono/diheme cytochrome c family protein
MAYICAARTFGKALGLLGSLLLAQPATSQKLSFDKEILPIFQRSCAPCHLGDAAMGKLQLGSPAALIRGGSSGPAIVSGKSADSLLVKRILGLTEAPRMPMGGDPLSDAQVKTIRAWIDQAGIDRTGLDQSDAAGAPAPAIAAAPSAKAADSPLFATTVRPILAARCYSCHGPTVQQNGLRLDSLAAVLQGSESGKIIVAGKPDSSRIMRRLQAQERPMMPYGGPALSPNEIAAIRQWIEAGAPGPDSTAPLAAAKVQKHWAYIKPVRPAVPRVNDAAWCKNPIDNFILAKLEAEGLKPSPEAPKPTLLRRVYLDLIGLPPTPAELDAFLADQTPDAYEKVVDRLLASPRYGERWARPWLDLARYADSNGYEKDNPRVAWEYRDWLIKALNQDMPFSEFTIEQIAGDMLPNPTNDQLIATGFHRNSMLNQEGGIDVEEYYWYSLVDRVNTTASVWLGSTLGCAQCHNHKFDPFPQKDYYRMLAFFSNGEHKKAGTGDSWMAETELPLPTSEQAKESRELSAQIDRLQSVLDTQTPQLDAAQQLWEKDLIASEKRWEVVKTSHLESVGGAALTAQADGSVLASGKNPQADTYKIAATASLAKLTGVRLEVLPDASLPHGGPGRDPDGNFFLSDFEMQVNGRPVIWKSSIADESQEGYPAKGIVTKRGNQLSGWAIDTGDGTADLRRRQVLFLPEEATGIPPGSTLTFILRHEMHKTSRNVGRFRISVSGLPNPEFVVQIPASLRAALAKPVQERSPEEKEKLSAAYRAVAPALDSTRAQMAGLRKQIAKLGIATAMIMKERPNFTRPAAYLRERGTFTSPGELVYADVPSAFNPLPRDAMPNRLGLAQWLVSEDNPLTARVTVNRFWETLFGRGIVETSEDFGSQGDLPSHPELLDWLATEFMHSSAKGTDAGRQTANELVTSGGSPDSVPVLRDSSLAWSMKKMRKLMVMSATYRQDSHVSEELEARDPYNRLYARGPRFRVEAEMVHDMVLAESGLLSSKMYGPSVYPYQPEGVWDIPYSEDKWVQSEGEDRYRRSIYTFIRRSAPYPSLVTYDAPSREFCTVRRVRTNTPLQALTSLNDPYFFAAARALAKRLQLEGGKSLADQIEFGYRLTVARPPSPSELSKVTAFYDRQLKAYQGDKTAADQTIGAKPGSVPDAPELAALTMLANVLLNMDEALTKE